MVSFRLFLPAYFLSTLTTATCPVPNYPVALNTGVRSIQDERRDQYNDLASPKRDLLVFVDRTGGWLTSGKRPEKRREKFFGIIKLESLNTFSSLFETGISHQKIEMGEQVIIYLKGLIWEDVYKRNIPEQI